jgi:hypothetical protein
MPNDLRNDRETCMGGQLIFHGFHEEFVASFLMAARRLGHGDQKL